MYLKWNQKNCKRAFVWTAFNLKHLVCAIFSNKTFNKRFIQNRLIPSLNNLFWRCTWQLLLITIYTLHKARRLYCCTSEQRRELQSPITLTNTNTCSVNNGTFWLIYKILIIKINKNVLLLITIEKLIIIKSN